MTMYSKIVLHSNLANIIIDYTLFIIIIKKLFKISKASFTAFSYALAIDQLSSKRYLQGSTNTRNHYKFDKKYQSIKKDNFIPWIRSSLSPLTEHLNIDSKSK